MFTRTNITLTQIDRAVLESCKTVCKGLSAYIGDGYELVMHSLEDTEHSVQLVLNGFHSGRTVGSAISEDELDMLEHIINGHSSNYICYLPDTKKGSPIKCNAIAVPGEKGRIVGLICLNFYLSTPLFQVLNTFLPCLDSQKGFDSSILQENYSGADNAICEIINEISAQVSSDPSVTAVNKNKEIISRLNTRGVFKMKESVIRCADVLGISKNTVYMHLRNLNSSNS